MSDDLAAALQLLELHFGPVRLAWQHRWRAVAFGPCPRCRWPAHTLAPNGSPFHPFCWLNPEEPGSFDQWVRRRNGMGERPAEVAEPVAEPLERQWCATGRRWFEATEERLDACVDHAAETAARWVR